MTRYHEDERHVGVFDGAFADTPHLVCYAVKANSNQTVLRRFADWGLGFEAVSGGELFRVLEAGASPDRVIFSGVGKTSDEIRFGLDAGILFFSVESHSELELISRVAKEQKEEERHSRMPGKHELVLECVLPRNLREEYVEFAHVEDVDRCTNR